LPTREAWTFTPRLATDIVLLRLLPRRGEVPQSELTRAAGRQLRENGNPRTVRAIRERILQLVKRGVLSRREVEGRHLVLVNPDVRIPFPARTQGTGAHAQPDPEALRVHWGRVRKEFLGPMAKQIPAVNLDGVFLAHRARPRERFEGSEIRSPLPFEKHLFFGCLGRHVEPGEDPRGLLPEFKGETHEYWRERAKWERKARDQLGRTGWLVHPNFVEGTAAPAAVNILLSLIELAAAGGPRSSLIESFQDGSVPIRVEKRTKDGEEETVMLPEAGDRFVFKVAGTVTLVGGKDLGDFESRAKQAWRNLARWAIQTAPREGRALALRYARLLRLRERILSRIHSCEKHETPTGPCRFT